jgi:hypothetical protein
MEVNGELHALAAVSPATQRVVGWVGPTAVPDILEKRESLLSCRHSNPVASNLT